jgi:hypothetical protein
MRRRDGNPRSEQHSAAGGSASSAATKLPVAGSKWASQQAFQTVRCSSSLSTKRGRPRSSLQQAGEKELEGVPAPAELCALIRDLPPWDERMNGRVRGRLFDRP